MMAAMRVDELVLVSVDDHVVEPPEMFDEHLPAAFRGRDDVPRVVRTEAGDDVWVYDGREFPNIGLNAVAGRPRDEYGIDPTSYDEMRRGCWDVDARIGDMNVNGVLASMCFPSFPRLCGQVFAEAQDKDLAAVLVRGVQRLARPVVVREAPRPIHSPRAGAVLGRRADGGRVGAPGGDGRACRLVLGEPVEARSP